MDLPPDLLRVLVGHLEHRTRHVLGKMRLTCREWRSAVDAETSAALVLHVAPQQSLPALRRLLSATTTRASMQFAASLSGPDLAPVLVMLPQLLTRLEVRSVRARARAPPSTPQPSTPEPMRPCAQAQIHA
jgi:hypothetical protein